MEDITKSEKAALYFQILERCTDWKEVYKIAIGEDRYNALSDKTKITNTSRWKASHKIQKAKEEIEMIFKAQKKEIEEKTKKGNFQGENKGVETSITLDNGKDLNFLDLDTFLREANKQANQITDDKEKRAWLELIGKYMSFKDRNEADEVEIKRFYTPLECEKCEIYNKCKDCKLSECPNIQ